MAFEQITNDLKGLSENSQEYLQNTKNYYELKVFKHGMKALVEGATLSIRSIFFMIVLLFISTGTAIALGEYYESMSKGFFIVGGFYFILFLLIVLFAKKPMERILLEKYSKIAFAKRTLEAERYSLVTKKIKDEGVL